MATRLLFLCILCYIAAPSRARADDSKNAGDPSHKDAAAAKQDPAPAAAANNPPAKRNEQPAAAANNPPAKRNEQPAAAANKSPAKRNEQPAAAANKSPAKRNEQPAAAANKSPAKDNEQPASPTCPSPAEGKECPKAGKPNDEGNEKLAAINKMIVNEVAQRSIASRMNTDGTCITDDKLLQLVFRADGVLACSPPSVPDNWRIRVYLVAPSGLQSDYLVSVALGDVDPSFIRTGIEAKPSTTADSNFQCNPTDQKDPCVKEVGVRQPDGKLLPFGPFERTDVTFRVQQKEATINEQAPKLKLLHHYAINVGLAALVGTGLRTYTIANKEIQEDTSKFDISYDVMLMTYPAAWYHGRNDDLRYGRVFDHDYVRLQDRLSVMGGFAVAHPADSLFLGLGFEPFVGLTIVGGWQPRRVQRLKPGAGVLDANMDGTVPTNTVWDTKAFAVGLSLDASIAKTISGLLSK